MGRKTVPALAALALALAACGGTSAAAAPTASQLAHKIPGCHTFLKQTPSVLATGDVTCSLGGASSAEVVTFATTGDEKQWITRQGNFYGCCVEGHLWAATYNSPFKSYFPQIKRALGGRVVAG